MNHLQGRVERLEHQAGHVGEFAALLDSLEQDDRIFLQGTLSAEARHKGGFEGYVKTLASSDLDRLMGIYQSAA
jgi:hypothetical protein